MNSRYFPLPFFFLFLNTDYKQIYTTFRKGNAAGKVTEWHTGDEVCRRRRAVGFPHHHALTAMPQAKYVVSYPGSSAGSVAMIATGLATAGWRKCCAKGNLRVLTAKSPPVPTALPVQRSQTFYKDAKCSPKLISPEAEVAPWCLSCPAGQGWHHILDEWPKAFLWSCLLQLQLHQCGSFKAPSSASEYLLYFPFEMKEQAWRASLGEKEYG